MKVPLGPVLERGKLISQSKLEDEPVGSSDPKAREGDSPGAGPVGEEALPGLGTEDSSPLPHRAAQGMTVIFPFAQLGPHCSPRHWDLWALV